MKLLLKKSGRSEMKTLVFFCIFLILIIPACNTDKSTNSEDKFKSDGVITGANYRDCACCGGWFIDIADSTFRFDLLPDGSSLDLMNETFPVEVRLDWHRKDFQCLGDEIIVDKIRKK